MKRERLESTPAPLDVFNRDGRGPHGSVGADRAGLGGGNTVKPVKKGGGKSLCVSIPKGRLGPSDTVGSNRPNTEEGTLLWGGEPPPFDEAWHRRVDDLNKELADDLRGRTRIVVSGWFIKRF